ncbi:MAG: hypothetical protein IPH62_16440 [Ignavibacteriae bacterium]|nr:hypothetical protein [Ignavibacteriota bacterium]
MEITLEIKNGQCLEILLFGTFSESKYFLDPSFQDSYNLIGFNANFVAFAPDGIAAFLARLKNKSYFIDPQFYAFQQSIETVLNKKNGITTLKTSIEKLALQYGDFINNNAGKKALTASDFNDIQLLDITKKVLKFQCEFLEKVSKEQDTSEFLDPTDFHPEFLISPYLLLDLDDLDNELEINKKFIIAANDLIEKKEISSKEIFAEIVFQKEVLFDTDAIDKIISVYHTLKISGFVIWIDSLNEFDASSHLLSKFKYFVSELGKSGIPIINLHGSFFSICLSSPEISLLAGVGHGVEYGEERPLIPVGGGVPLAKFYFPRFHKRINYYPDATSILIRKNWILNKEVYFKNVCNCETCQELNNKNSNVYEAFQVFGETKISTKNNKAYPTSNAMDKSRRHYLNIKQNEYKYCKFSTKEKIITNLKKSLDIANELAEIHDFSYIDRWINQIIK